MNQNDQMREALREFLVQEMPAGTVIGNPEWWVPKIMQALNHTPDTGKMVDHVGDSNKMVRLTDEKLTEIYMRFVGHEGLSPRIFEDVAGCVMAAMIKENGGQS